MTRLPILLLLACSHAPRPIANECTAPREPAPRVVNCSEPRYRCVHWETGRQGTFGSRGMR